MIEYTHKVHSRSKSIKLSINKNGEVIVTSPRFIPQFVIRKFVNAQQDWISHQLSKLNTVKKNLGVAENEVLLFGKAYALIIKLDPKKPIGITRDGDSLIINPVSDTKVSIQKNLDRFLKNLGSSFILKQTETLAERMSTTYGHVSFKTQKTRWGSCSSKGNLNFNWRLVHAPPEVITYVIIHELAHRTHMDHSARFWKLVSQYDGEYLKHRGWLKRQGMALND
ncbi:MAG: SprT family zinc-dependent metalloprotease [Patescibacteria group bacterium]